MRADRFATQAASELRAIEHLKNAVATAVALAIGLLAIEFSLRWSGWYPEKREAPAWFSAILHGTSATRPNDRDPISDIELPDATHPVELLPDVLDVRPPPGKPAPPDRAAWTQPPFYAFSPVTGGTLAPHAEGWWMEEGLAYVTVNGEGFRDVDHIVPKPNGVLRIAVLGDSFAEALQVPQENAFWSVLNRKLRECPALGERNVEVLNFGVSGFGTTQELLAYREWARKYAPDLVLLSFFPGNDLQDNVRSLSERAGPVALIKPFYTLSGGELVLDDGFLDRRRGAAKRFRAWAERLRIVQLLRIVADWTERRNPASEDRALVSPPDPEYARAWAVTEAVLRRLNEEVRADGGRLIVTTVSMAEQADPDPVRRAEWMRERGVADLFYPDKRLYALSQAASFDMVPLAPAMARIAERTGKYLHGFPDQWPGRGHWNHNGHAVAGQILAQELCKRLQPREIPSDGRK